MKKIVVLTGAGVSAESGLSTYRDNNGLWDNYDPMEVASIEGWHRDKKKVLSFYNMQRKKLSAVEPNDAHKAIASLQDSYDVCVITQNVDNLHERAGSRNVIHLHGEAVKVRPEYGEYDRTYSEKEVIDVGYAEVNPGDVTSDGRQLRPHIVFFGEAVPKIQDAANIVSQADILLIVGTSFQVYPAAGLYQYARYDAKIYVIDPADIPVPSSRIVHIKENATSGMQRFLSMIADSYR